MTLSTYKNILFDLDGTITDPGIGITNSVMYALEKFGITVTERSSLYKFIGPPLWDSFSKNYGFSQEDSQKAVEFYREYYREKGIFENYVYDGIEDLFITLKQHNMNLFVATSKPEVFAIQVLEHFNLSKYFTYIAGGNLEGTRVKKGDIIRYALETCNISDIQNTIMIGDREQDVFGAKQCGIKSIGILFGYGDRHELETAGADYIAETTQDIKNLLLSNS